MDSGLMNMVGNGTVGLTTGVAAMEKYVVCPNCNRSVRLEDGGIDLKTYVCDNCGVRLRYRVKSKLDAERRASEKRQLADEERARREAAEKKRERAVEVIEARIANAPAPSNEVDFRRRWRADFRCEDGHYVRSKNELIVDNWLYSHGIPHAYEKSVYDQETDDWLCSDFFVPSKSLYIEIWGLTSQEYESNRKRKVELYRRLGCRLLEIDGDDVKNIDDVLSRVFARHGRDQQ